MKKDAIYVGIENEFIPYNRLNFKHNNLTADFVPLAKKHNQPTYYKGGHTIRTHLGHGIYIDGAEPEICTAPVRIRKGFVKEFGDTLHNARKNLLDILEIDKISIIGYSSHWNISMPSDFEEYLPKYISTPLALFSLTPISYASNFRTKSDPSNRVEYLGDYIESVEQNEAFMLLYSSAVLNSEKIVRNFKLAKPETITTEQVIKNPLKDGRYSQIKVFDREKQQYKTIKAQEYLEELYDFLEQDIKQIANPSEISNLEAYITGKKVLEIDLLKKYAHLSKIKKSKEYDFDKRLIVLKNNYEDFKPIPEGPSKLLSELTSRNESKYFNGDELSTEGLSWSDFQIQSDGGYINSGDLKSVDHIDTLARFTELIPSELRLASLKTICDISHLNKHHVTNEEISEIEFDTFQNINYIDKLNSKKIKKILIKDKEFRSRYKSKKIWNEPITQDMVNTWLKDKLEKAIYEKKKDIKYKDEKTTNIDESLIDLKEYDYEKDTFYDKAFISGNQSTLKLIINKSAPTTKVKNKFFFIALGAFATTMFFNIGYDKFSDDIPVKPEIKVEEYKPALDSLNTGFVQEQWEDE
ncbi:hypothetical protein K9L97_05495 [Candidatus Woesearchaeota archaeon]|nr:hypothetical protein [Candidatus Woesearchaeota archaeon]